MGGVKRWLEGARLQHLGASCLAEWPIWLLGVIGAVLSVIFLVGPLAYSESSISSRIQQQKQELHNVAGVLAEHINHVVQSVELTQDRIAEYIAAGDVETVETFDSKLGDHGVHEALQHFLGGQSELDALVLVDARGKLINFTRYWPIPAVDISDRDYFQTIASNPAIRTIFSGPIQNRSDGTWTWYIARRVNSRSGEFLGVVLAALNIRYFENAFASIRLEPQSAISLFRADGTLLSRWPRADAALGENFPLAQRAVAQQESAFLEIQGLIDGDRKLLAAQRVGGFPLFVTVAEDKDLILAPWKRERTLLVTAGSLAYLVIAFLVALIMWQMLSRRRQDASAVEETNRQLNLALNHISQGFCYFDRSERLVFWNQRYLQLYGLDEKALHAGMSFKEVLHAKSRAGSFAGDVEQFSDSLLAQVRSEGVHRHIRSIGADGVLAVVSRQVPDGGWVVTHDDITDLHRTRVEAERSRAFLRTIVDSVPAAIIVKDAATLQYVLANRSAEALLAKKQEEIIGYRAHDLFPADFADKVVAGDQYAIADANVLFDELQLDRRGAEKKVFSVTRAPVVEQGHTRWLVKIYEDITARQAARDSMHHAQKMEAIAHLTGGVAHDFNKLLLVMIGNLDLLAEELANLPEALEKVEAVLQASLRGRELVQRMLAFARRQPLQPKSVNVDRLVEQTVQLLERTLEDKITIQTSLRAGSVDALIDESQLQGAIVNIALNARDAMPNGGILTIETSEKSVLSVSQGLPAGDYVTIRIADTGCGMTDDVKEHLFEPFFTTKAVSKGTGLGLSMVYGLIQEAGGGITVDSRPGQGSSFTLHLPKVAGVRRDQLCELPVPEGGPEISRSILLVDDNHSARTTVHRQLCQLGYTVYEAFDADEALTFLKRHKDIELLITDLCMPNIDGKQLANLACELRPALKVLFISGFSGSLAQNQSQGESLLKKPFRKHELAAAITHLFESRQRAA